MTAVYPNTHELFLLTTTLSWTMVHLYWPTMDNVNLNGSHVAAGMKLELRFNLHFREN